MTPEFFPRLTSRKVSAGEKKKNTSSSHLMNQARDKNVSD